MSTCNAPYYLFITCQRAARYRGYLSVQNSSDPVGGAKYRGRAVKLKRCLSVTSPPSMRCMRAEATLNELTTWMYVS